MKNTIPSIIILIALMAACSPISKEYAGEYEVSSVEFTAPQSDKTIKLNLTNDGLSNFISSKIIIDRSGNCQVVNTVNKGMYVRIDMYDNILNQLIPKLLPDISYIATDRMSAVAVQISDKYYQAVDVLLREDLKYCSEKNAGIYTGLKFYASQEMYKYGADIAELDKHDHSIVYGKGKNKIIFHLKKIEK